MATDWSLKRRIEREYSQAIARILVRLPDAENIRSPAELLAAVENWSGSAVFKKSLQAVVASWITHINDGNSRSWREAARKSSKSRLIYQSLQKELAGTAGVKIAEIAKKNAKHISSLPLELAERATQYITDQAFKGVRSEELAKELLTRYKHLSESRAKLIARTESSKAQTALTRVRSEDLGLVWYIWTTSKDQRVRESHEHMDGVIINWNDPPSPEALAGERSYGNYHAGDTFNCRCYPRPLLSPGDVSWPHKVYYNGRIQIMTRKRFEEVA